jgi:hydrogenase nickel incorporation protein HypA/HybF
VHELSLAAEILRLVQDAAARERFQRVAMLRLEAGALAGVEVGALRFALDAVAPGTCLEGASIDIEEPPGRGVLLRPNGGDALRVLDLLVQSD